jgi:hypothetical protein
MIIETVIISPLIFGIVTSYFVQHSLVARPLSSHITKKHQRNLKQYGL